MPAACAAIGQPPGGGIRTEFSVDLKTNLAGNVHDVALPPDEIVCVTVSTPRVSDIRAGRAAVQNGRRTDHLARW